MSVGFVGAAGSAAGLVALYDTKADLLRRQAHLQEEVKLALALQTGYKSLSGQVSNAVTASSAMSNAWSSLSSDLQNLTADIKKGTEPEKSAVLQKLFRGKSIQEVQTVLNDVTTIKQQLAGVQNIVRPDQPITDLIRSYAN